MQRQRRKRVYENAKLKNGIQPAVEWFERKVHGKKQIAEKKMSL